MQFIDNWLKTAQNLLPQDCLLCGAASGSDHLCVGCLEDLPLHRGTQCRVCGIPTPQDSLCGACLKHPPHFDATCAAFVYAFPIDALLRALKYQGRLPVAQVAGDQLAQVAAGRTRPDILIPMPLHHERLRERGFNQAAEIARVVAASLNIPCIADIALRVRMTEPQAGLPLEKRRKNMRNAFACTSDLAGMHLAVVDDVMTSGASLDELARTLKAAGAARVECWVAARTPLD
jgi:ComF family protein